MSQENTELVNLSQFSSNQGQLVSLDDNSFSSQRELAKRQFYSQKQTMAQKVGNAKSVSQVINEAIQEMANSYDNLSGTQQMLLNNGQVLNSTVLVDKKVQVLSTMTDALKKKNDIQRQNRSIDVTSPQVQLLIKIILQKVFLVLKQNIKSSDQQILIINKITESLNDWDKEFKKRLSNLQSL